jgi:glucose/arabinose dehydrogenase
VDRGGTREVKTIAEKLELPNGIEFHKGSLYVATPKAITRYDGIEDKLDNPPTPVTIYDKLPGDIPHGWKFIKIGPDGKLYVPVGAPCNICEPSDQYAQIRRINLDGSGMEVVARGVRNTVGFDFHPKTGELWFTDNQRDWLSEDLPNDELNHLTKVGQHFGYPYCHQGDFADPQFGWGKACDDFVKPALLLGPHSAPLGMRFYTGKMFPAKYQNAIFIARHGPWNRTKKYAADVVVVYLNANGTVRSMEPFLTGLVENNGYLGRPVDVLVLKDGSLLVSDDHAGAVYRVSYGRCRLSAGRGRSCRPRPASRGPPGWRPSCSCWRFPPCGPSRPLRRPCRQCPCRQCPCRQWTSGSPSAWPATAPTASPASRRRPRSEASPRFSRSRSSSCSGKAGAIARP